MPDTAREYGDPFNEDYERWVRESTGGPPHREYLVERSGERAWFDATVTEPRGGKPTEVLIDAKGRYEQFVDPGTGEFKKFWTRMEDKGLRRLLRTASRQVRVAGDRPVEWWCSERAAARAFNNAIRRVPELRGRLRAVYKPMPNGEG